MFLGSESQAKTQWDRRLEFGTQAATLMQKLGSPASFTRTRPYLDLGFTGKVPLGKDSGSPSEFAVRLRARGWLDSYGGSAKSPAEFFPVAGSFSFSKDWFRAEIGLQQIAWGKSFGIFISDLVNPRDLRDPFFNELGWTRIAQGAINLEVNTDRLSVQGIYVPLPFDPILPIAGTVFDPLQNDASLASLRRKDYRPWDWGRFWDFGEGGGRAEYRAEMGLEVAAFGYSHLARAPAYGLVSAPEEPTGLALEPVRMRVHSFGLSASQKIADRWTARAEAVLHLDQPSLFIAPVGANPGTFTQVRSIWGVDWKTEFGPDLGGQYHFENFAPGGGRHWTGLRASWSFFEGKLVPEAFALLGMGNGDVWLQPQLSWMPDNNWRVSVRADLAGGINGLDTGYFPGGSDYSRVMAWIAWKME